MHEAAEDIVPKIPALEKEDIAVCKYIGRELHPDVIMKPPCSISPLCALQTTFRLPDGHLMGWEGVFDGESARVSVLAPRVEL